MKYNLKQNSTLLISLAHGFFNIITAKTVNDLRGSGRITTN